MTWEMGVMGYMAALLAVYPALAGRFKWIGFLLILGAGFLLITGLLRVV